MTQSHWDVIVIGGGPGGYVAAIRAAQLGQKVALIESQHLGGVCLNWGCIPTKALLKSADVLDEMRHAEELGIHMTSAPSVDVQRVVKRSRDISQKLSQGVQHLLKKNKVTTLIGYGTLLGEGRVSVHVSPDEAPSLHKASAIIVATGARARVIPGLEPDGKRIWTAKEAMTPQHIPTSMVVVGSGAIGLEFGCFYRRLGTQVHVVEVQDRVLPQSDAEISALAQKAFEKQGIIFHTHSSVQGAQHTPKGLKVSVKTGSQTHSLDVECMIVAVGIIGNTENLGLEKTRVRVDRGHIVTDAFGQTDEPGVYAIGDVASPPWLAHKASHEAIACVEKIVLGKAHAVDLEKVPACVYTSPQVAQVGMTEEQARTAGYDVRVGRFPFMGNGKALVLGCDQGLVKTLFDRKTGELLGAHMIGAEVTELIQGYALGQTLEATEEDFMHTIFPHPTLSEMIHESVLQAYDRAIHI